ncbi:uncharacterized protein TNCV_1617971 [Trichonephila clavipes]|nr:uncharacterized protein TNCV_1617971 [Trichonephila clavipes]
MGAVELIVLKPPPPLTEDDIVKQLAELSEVYVILVVIAKKNSFLFKVLMMCRTLKMKRDCGSPMVKVSDHGRYVMNLSPVSLKIRRVGQRCTLNLSRAETSSRWGGVVVWRGFQFRCRSRHLTRAHNDVVRRQKPSCS